jgi:alcohol dehydrogenase, propanol-preferring
MRAMVLHHPKPASRGPLTYAQRTDPTAGPDQIVLDVRACAICRTDLQICEGDLATRSLPVVPGHQAVGTVVELGSSVRRFRLGDRVGIGWLAHADGTCEQCVRGQENLCARAQFTGWDRDGGYASKIVVSSAFAFPIPAGFDDLAAAPLLCGGVIGYRALKRSGIRPGGRLGLYGFGASATLAIQVARHWGCRVFVVTRSAADQERAKALGAEWVGSYDSPPPLPLDAAVTFAPSGDVVRRALSALGRGATVAINAIHLDRIPELPYQDLWWERSIASVANYTRADATEFLELAAQIPIRTQVEVHPLEDANLALDRLARGLVEGASVLEIR